MMNRKDVIEAGQLRKWKEMYFTLTPPNPGYECFLVIRRLVDNEWDVMFPCNSIIKMSAEGIKKLSNLIESLSVNEISESR